MCRAPVSSISLPGPYQHSSEDAVNRTTWAIADRGRLPTDGQHLSARACAVAVGQDVLGLHPALSDEMRGWGWGGGGGTPVHTGADVTVSQSSIIPCRERLGSGEKRKLERGREWGRMRKGRKGEEEGGRMGRGFLTEPGAVRKDCYAIFTEPP
ncbi:unnamed protein product [Pleuronectes platessa]|uniref:Uncharacterized protein n=1 Tax=Pleuronectes platessa TaxID=8262 RepID=A0A9N7TUF4_PLEPL|nr:unnamed protein product [Pleuronectes platessa]